MAKVPVIDIRPCDLDIVREILRRHVPNHEVLAFGSRVKWTARQYSDLDLAIRSDEAIPTDIIYAIKNELSESRLPMMVDVLDMASVSEKFRGIIEAEYAVVQEKNAAPLIPFDKAVEINPKIHLKRGEVYPYVDMKQVNPESRSVRSNENREFKGSGSRFESGDTLMARITPCLENGKIARFVSDNQPGHGSTEFIVIRGKDGVTDNDFAYYLTRWEKVRSFAISQMSGTSGRQRVPANSLGQLEIPLPPLAEQKRIARILGALDDKIELNRRMNRTLEAMAQAIFKSWFVDFDPVRAKAKRRPTGLPPEIAELFPAQFQDSELGKIPRGWEIGQLQDIASIKGGKQLPTEKRGLWGAYPVFGANGNMGYADERTHDGFVIAFGRVGAYCGSVHWATSGAWINNNAGAVVPLANPAFVLQAMLNVDFERMRMGTAQPYIPNSALGATPIIIPPHPVMERYSVLANPFRNEQGKNLAESHKLALMRDTLLPDMISGGIRPEPAGKQVKAST